LNNGPGFYPNIYRGIANESFINPTLDLDTITSVVSACAKATLSYKFLRYYGRTAVGIVPNSEQWNFGEGAGFVSGLGSNPIHTFASGGTYTVTLKVTDATCNSVWTMSKLITVTTCTTPPPTCTYNLQAKIKPVADTTVDDTNPTVVNFDGSTSVFDAAGAEPHKFYWMNGSADTTTAFSKNSTSSLSFAFNGAGGNLPQGGPYKIYLVIKQGRCLDTVIVGFNVIHDACAGIKAKIVAVNEVVVDVENPVTVDFSALTSVFPGSLSPKQYYWILGSADTSAAYSKDSVSALTFSYKGRGGHNPNGSYDIFLVIKRGNCMDTVSSHLNVDYFFIPNLLTPNGDAFNDQFDITNIGNRFDLEVYNRWGERIFMEKGYTNNWDLSKVHDGIYYYLLTDGLSDKKYKGWVHVIHASL